MAKAQMLNALNHKIKPLLAKPFQDQVQVANWRDKILVLQVKNSGLATRLQYELPQLTRQVQGLGIDVKQIRLLNSPEEQAQQAPKREVTRPGHAAATALNSAMKNVDDPKLKASLASMAKNFEDNK